MIEIMKKYVLVLVLLFVVTNMYSDIINEIPAPFPMPMKASDLGIKGNVTEVYQEKYVGRMLFGKPKKNASGFQSRESFTFKDGLLVAYASRGLETSEWKYQIIYSSPNTISEVNECSFRTQDNKPSYTYYKLIYTYTNGKLAQVERRETDENYQVLGAETISLYEIGYSGNKMAIKAYDSRGYVSSIYVYESNRLTAYIDYDVLDGKERKIFEYSYNNKGQVLTKTITTRYSETQTKISYKYDARGWDSAYSYDLDATGNWLLMYQQPSKPNDGIWIYERKITYSDPINIPNNRLIKRGQGVPITKYNN